VRQSWLLPVDFPSYLEAKIGVDDRSLHPRLLQAVRERIRGQQSARLLDIGTGTGAMLRRLLGPSLEAGAELVGLDPDPRSLEVAGERIRQELEDSGSAADRPDPEPSMASGSHDGILWGRLRLRLLQGELFGEGLVEQLGGRRFDLVTAHAVLDLLPLRRALGRIRELLRPGGWLYATINYDGLTVLLPSYENPSLERRLLELYDLSMEARRVGGRAAAGSLSGRRLCESLPGCGFAIRDAGASDWLVMAQPQPALGRADGRGVFLRTLLTFIATEALAGGLDPAALRRWYRRRLEAIEDGSLTLIAHQLDVLAEALP
jgi:SAM-dependent methyltransferase